MRGGIEKPLARHNRQPPNLDHREPLSGDDPCAADQLQHAEVCRGIERRGRGKAATAIIAKGDRGRANHHQVS